jgi:hypothetical protein
MKLTVLPIATVLLLISATAAGYEFEVSSMRTEAAWSSYEMRNLAKPPAWAVPTGMRQVEETVKPEECRFYLTYEDEGREHVPLLEQAKLVNEQLRKALADIEQAKVEIEPFNYSPEKSWRGLFVGEKTDISLTFRVTIKLAVEGEDAFWENAELVAEALERIAGAREEGNWGRKLKEGRVAYAVESIEPTKRLLYGKIEEEVKAMRKSLGAANERDTSDIFCVVEYGIPSASSVTLEEVKVALPYRVEFKLERQAE